jgi:hypothetical protein
MFAGRYENASDKRVNLSAPMMNKDKEIGGFPAGQVFQKKRPPDYRHDQKKPSDIHQDFYQQDPFRGKHERCGHRRIKTVRPQGIPGHGYKGSSSV